MDGTSCRIRQKCHVPLWNQEALCAQRGVVRLVGCSPYTVLFTSISLNGLFWRREYVRMTARNGTIEADGDRRARAQTLFVFYSNESILRLRKNRLLLRSLSLLHHTTTLAVLPSLSRVTFVFTILAKNPRDRRYFSF